VIVSVRVVLKSSRQKVQEDGSKLKVYLTRPAQDGQANAQLIEILTGHFKVRKYQLRIISGLKSRDKLIEVVS